MTTCETCNLPVYDWGNEDAPQGGYCDDCGVGICARDGCAGKAPEVCCDECPVHGLCWECASLRWCPEFPNALLMEARVILGMIPAIFDRPGRVAMVITS